ncbi:hypothetical protein B0T26DRAFT_679303 [Lasiosphaeria miniovina]|uniref:Uncharacterized protein n=1 Tax=Lasiosphaeria miniovina TaxID=1954250 RepID=A0AA40A621_9PEZI|nr:uncharacterized protein B0T26DRAFT_679303 [Lasiosphaeria miniovina]KAK0709961.1 hypothetical protein B0T26DRAFT_679303 [Lasiosphaeria miniovina]
MAVVMLMMVVVSTAAHLLPASGHTESSGAVELLVYGGGGSANQMGKRQKRDTKTEIEVDSSTATEQITLPDAEDSFRLLELLPGQHDDPVKIRPVDSRLSTAPPYESLSYTPPTRATRSTPCCRSSTPSTTRHSRSCARPGSSMTTPSAKCHATGPSSYRPTTSAAPRARSRPTSLSASTGSYASSSPARLPPACPRGPPTGASARAPRSRAGSTFPRFTSAPASEATDSSRGTWQKPLASRTRPCLKSLPPPLVTSQTGACNSRSRPSASPPSPSSAPYAAEDEVVVPAGEETGSGKGKPKKKKKKEKIPLADIFKDALSSYRLQAETILGVCDGKRFFVTDAGHIGLGPADARVGDAVWVLGHVRMPYICRVVGDGVAGLDSKESMVRLLDASYVFGAISGQVWTDVERGEKKVEVLTVW